MAGPSDQDAVGELTDSELIVASAPRAFAGALRRPSEAEIDEIVARYETGDRNIDLARRFGLDPSTIWRHLRDRQVQSNYQWSAEELDEARSLYEDGATLDDISLRTGRSRGTVRRRLLEAGVELRSRGRRVRDPGVSPGR